MGSAAPVFAAWPTAGRGRWLAAVGGRATAPSLCSGSCVPLSAAAGAFLKVLRPRAATRRPLAAVGGPLLGRGHPRGVAARRCGRRAATPRATPSLWKTRVCSACLLASALGVPLRHEWAPGRRRLSAGALTLVGLTKLERSEYPGGAVAVAEQQGCGWWLCSSAVCRLRRCSGARDGRHRAPRGLGPGQEPHGAAGAAALLRRCARQGARRGLESRGAAVPRGATPAVCRCEELWSAEPSTP